VRTALCCVHVRDIAQAALSTTQCDSGYAESPSGSRPLAFLAVPSTRGIRSSVRA
jgi:hypothetical protein